MREPLPATLSLITTITTIMITPPSHPCFHVRRMRLQQWRSRPRCFRRAAVNLDSRGWDVTHQRERLEQQNCDKGRALDIDFADQPRGPYPWEVPVDGDAELRNMVAVEKEKSTDFIQGAVGLADAGA